MSTTSPIWSRFLTLIFGAGLLLILALPGDTWGDNKLGQKLQDYKVTLGLDLAGGTELDYKIDMTEVELRNSDENKENDMTLMEIQQMTVDVRDAIEKRVNPAGVGEILVKNARMNGEYHVIVQLPPSSNVEQIKRDAEKDNRLRFYAEDVKGEEKARLRIALEMIKTKADNFLERGATLALDENVNLRSDTVKLSEMSDPNFAKLLADTAAGEVVQSVVSTQTEMAYEIDESGAMTISSLPERIIGIVKVNEKTPVQTTEEVEATVTARHILFGHPDATGGSADMLYASEEEAKAKAMETLDLLKKDGLGDFDALAKKLSTEPSAATEAGNLGTFGKGRMVPPFEEAVFGRTETGLVPELVTTDFGFHIIDVMALAPAETKTVDTFDVSYDFIAWNLDAFSWSETELDGKFLEKAAVGTDPTSRALEVALLFSAEGGALFAKITGELAGQSCDGRPCRLGIKVGENFVSQPTVTQQIFGTRSRITGSFTREEVQSLVKDLQLGAIAAPVRLSGQITINPTLGAEQLAKSIKAALFGFLGTLVFMICIYRWAGVLAGVALTIYAGLLIVAIKYWPGSFGGPIVMTLSGAAGMALSLGLAVDGNILIFERLKEELRRGRSLTQAVELGFDRAWTAIRDSNSTTLLVCVILFSLGSSMIQGFAIVLILGTVFSMFTAIVITRNLLRFSIRFDCLKKTSLYGVAEKDIGKSVDQNVRKR